MSVTSILQSAQYRFGQGPENIRFQDDFYSAINDAQRDFSTIRNWGFLRTTGSLTSVEGVRAVALPSDFGTPYDIPGALRITSPSANSGDTIELMPYEQWLSSTNYDDGTETGTPSYAYILGDNLNLSPLPDAAYTIAIIYHKIPAAIADSSSTITIPTVYEELLRKMIYRRLQDAGWSSERELVISDADIQRLMNSCARMDSRKYGGATFNLAPSAYTRSTV
jgi:hypothetical protein